MRRKFTFAAVVIQVALLSGCAFHRRLILEQPIRFERGFVFTKGFTVDIAKRYALVLHFDAHTQIRDHVEAIDQFSAEFRITSMGEVITEGTNKTLPNAEGFSPKETTRYLVFFKAQPGIKYELWFRITEADSSLTKTHPVVAIFLAPTESLYD